MKYSEIKIKTSEGGMETVTGLLLSLGIEETVINAGSTAMDILDKKEGYEWDYVNPDIFTGEKISSQNEAEILFYLSQDDEGEKLYSLVEEKIQELKKADIGDLGALKVEKTVVDDCDWIKIYRDSLKAIALGDRIIVKPTWKEIENLDNKIEINLDPGMAFGTGDHPTTSMCAELMIECGCEGKDILDVGTGSGILAIIAQKLGGNHILGVDIDEIAVEVARENGRINNCTDNVIFEAGDLTKGLDFQADIVVGNLMAEVVIMLSEAVKNHMKPNGVFISSGILIEKEDMVKKALQNNGLKIEKVTREGEWCAIMAR